MNRRTSSIAPLEAAVQRWSTVDVIVQMLGIGVFFANIFLKMWRARLLDARRGLQLMVSGAAVSLTPVLLLALAALLMGRAFTAFVTFSPWLWIPSLLLLFLFPVTLAYVIVVAHAMEVNVVIRQGLQYALARSGALCPPTSAIGQSTFSICCKRSILVTIRFSSSCLSSGHPIQRQKWTGS